MEHVGIAWNKKRKERNTMRNILKQAIFFSLVFAFVGGLPYPSASQTLVASLELPLVRLGDFQYAGGFRVPAQVYGASDVNYSEGPIGYNAGNHSLFIVGHSHHQALAEFGIPPLVKSSNLSELPMAGAPVQHFSPVLNRVAGGNPQILNRIGGMQVLAGPHGPELLVNAYEYYDGASDNTQTTLVIRDGQNLATSPIDGFYSFQGAAHTSGWISPVPPEWEAALGGALLTGHSSGIPIISRTSVGPSAFAFDPLAFVGGASPTSQVPTIRLLDFHLNNGLHDDLSNASGTNGLWTHLSRVTYGFIPPGTRTLVTLGYSGGHTSGVCYKCTQNTGKVCGGFCTPDSNDNYPYYWFWDIKDLLAVKEGRMNSYDVRPYDYGKFPTPLPGEQLGGGSFDPSTGLLYLTIQKGDNLQGQYATPPVIVAYTVTPDTPVTPDTTPPSIPSGVQAEALSATQVQVTWEAAVDDVGVTGYVVYRNNVPLATTTSRMYVDTNVVPATTYTYGVWAEDAAGNVSSMSDLVSVSIPRLTDTTPPSIPSGVQAATLSERQVQVTWEAAVDDVGVTGYVVYRNNVPLATTTSRMYVDTNVVPATTYTYGVWAEDAAGNASASSALVTVSTSDIDENPTPPPPSLELPLVRLGDFQYVGGFRVPAQVYGASDVNYSEGPIGYNAGNHSLFIVGHSHHQALAEFGIPPLVKSSNLSELPMAGAPVQHFSPVLNRVAGGNPQILNRIGGMQVLPGPHGPELLVNAYEYYDGASDNTQTTLVIRDGQNLATSPIDGFYSFQGAAHTSGWISPVPPEWEAALGGALLTGHSSGIPIISRTSVGPSAFAFDPLAFVGGASPTSQVPTIRLLDFHLNNGLHDDLSNASGTNGLWTHLSRVTYGFIPPGTRTLVTLGYSGGHTSGVCYKCTQNTGKVCGGFCTPDSNDNYPYYWFWDIKDLLAVKEGRMNSYDVRPYDYGKFPTPLPGEQLGGGSFDPSTGLLYLTIQKGDNLQGQYATPPVIVAYTVTPDTPVTPDTTPPSIPSGVQAEALSATQVQVTWEAAVDDVGVTGYVVYRNNAPLATTTSRMYVDTNVVPATTYTYGVWAEDAAGNVSSMSDLVSVSIPRLTDTTPPSIPSGVQAATLSERQVQVTWEAAVDDVGVTGYVVYRNNVPLATTTSRMYVDTNVVPATTYTYGVWAEDAAGNASASSALVTVSTNNPLIISDFNFGHSQSHRIMEKGILKPGANPFLDSFQVFPSVGIPEHLLGGTYIQNIQLDNSVNRGDYFSFKVNQPVTIYIVVAREQASKPSWLGNYDLSGESFLTNGGKIVDLYSRQFEAGMVRIGGDIPNESLQPDVNYSVVVIPSNSKRAYLPLR